jgi:hypothetical protein
LIRRGNNHAKKYETADLSTFEKLEGVGKEAYWKRWQETLKGAGDTYRFQALMAEVTERIRAKPIILASLPRKRHLAAVAHSRFWHLRTFATPHPKAPLSS